MAAPDNYYAAEYCGNMVYGGYSDWYLPAINELHDKVYPVKDLLSGYIVGGYSSSIEQNQYYKRILDLDGVIYYISDKTNNDFIRCARRN